ncbi:hypothetical protein [Numidum massiliense]|uniref:hypothetical protein n=1 Tax=Numidum massiliense TaxID=1522315 RepID=UPI0006D5388E|nr:hypothetical protein [Numidum massiliense]
MKNEEQQRKQISLQRKEPTIAPGLNDRELLEHKATEAEIRAGNSTEVTTLTYDETEPSD